MPQFKSHLEYIHHITCTTCNHYWTYATTNHKFRIDRGEWFCPACGRKGNVHEEDHRISLEEENFFSKLKTDTSETSSDWFPDLSLSLKSVSDSGCACGENKTCQCDDEWYPHARKYAKWFLRKKFVQGVGAHFERLASGLGCRIKNARPLCWTYSRVWKNLSTNIENSKLDTNAFISSDRN